MGITAGRSLRGERGLKCRMLGELREGGQCRSLRGERGLKYDGTGYKYGRRRRRSLRGERGLKCHRWFTVVGGRGRSLRGERGLKFLFQVVNSVGDSSFPSRGTWIEIFYNLLFLKIRGRRSLRGERGLKS